MTQHFFIGGAQRSGTTYAYHLCADHPEIEMALPVRPEPKFYLNPKLYSQGYAYYRSTYFGKKPGARLYGEKSTSYIEVASAAKAMAEQIPDAKIVFVLRNPIERAISNYRFSLFHGVENVSMEEAFRREAERVEQFDHQKYSVSPYAYLRRGRYIEYIEMWEQFFRPEQIHILIYEQMVSADAPVRGLYAFLGVDTEYRAPTRGEIINANSEDAGEELSVALRTELQAHYAPYTARLRAHTGLAIPEWDVA
ncbi:MAG: hypothetical protein RLY87_1004 [Chloroflexota bacterium]|jgi:hypothetical protein